MTDGHEKERIRRCKAKMETNIKDFAKDNTKKDGTKVTAADLTGHHKLYHEALQKILDAEEG